jgi:hypothetical protein
MHLAMPARKSSNPPPYATRSPRFPMLRRSRVQAIVLCACAVGAVIFILSQVLGGGSERIPSGTPPVVIVTVLDPESYNKDYINKIKENRIEYAKKHGKRLCRTGRIEVLIESRICNVFPCGNRLRIERISAFLGSSSCCPTCTHQVFS